MNNTTAIKARGESRVGFNSIQYLWKTQPYVNYLGEEKSLMSWHGAWANDFGLQGQPITEEAMLHLAAGRSPDGKTDLCQNAGELPTATVKLDPKTGQPRLDKNGNQIIVYEGGHRVGYDITFTANKSFSLAFKDADAHEKELLLGVQDRANQRAMEYLQSKIETRRGHGGKDVYGNVELIWSSHTHLTSRENEASTHTHNLVYGICKGADGQTGTFDSKEFYRHRKASDRIYMNELAMGVQELNYAVVQERVLNGMGKETGETKWEIKGFSQERIDFESTRHQQIDAAKETGLSDQEAWAQTRKEKDEPPFPELLQLWVKTNADYLAQNPDQHILSTQELKQLESTFVSAHKDEQILERLHKSESTFCDYNLLEELGMEYAGQMATDAILERVETFKGNNGLAHLDGKKIHDDDAGVSLSRVNSETRYAAPWMVDWEEEIVHRATSRQDETHAHVPQEIIDKAVLNNEARKGYGLTDEQRSVVQYVLQSPGVIAIEGRAGTGKTATSDCFLEAFTTAGFTTYGACDSNAAAKKLEQETGMKSFSTAMLLHKLDKEHLKLDKTSVVLLDESGMSDTDKTRRLMAYCSDAQAKLVMQGDIHQLSSVGAGSGMSLVQNEIGSAKLTEIFRQANPEDRKLVNMFYDGNDSGSDPKSRAETANKSGAIWDEMKRRNMVDAYNEKPEAMRALVQDYFRSDKPIDERLVIGHTREDVTALNTAIHKGLQDQGQVSKKEVTFKARDRNEWTQLTVSEGDRIRFLARDNTMGVINGSLGTIDSISHARDGSFDLTVLIKGITEKEQERSLTFNTARDFNALQLDYAITLHRAQGQGKSDVFDLGHVGMADNASSLVAVSRLTKGKYMLYGSADDLEHIGERVGMDRLKENALDAGLKQHQPSYTPKEEFVQTQALVQTPTRKDGLTQTMSM